MNIAEEVTFNKEGLIEPGGSIRPWRHLFLSLVIVLVAGLSFGIGRLTGVGKSEPIKIEYDASISNAGTPNSTQTKTASVINTIPEGKSAVEVVASKSGTKYHYLYCAGAKQIKEANKITFASPQAAEAAGFTLAANCSPR